MRYNNVHFHTIVVHEADYPYQLPEPLWFTLCNDNLSVLRIFINTGWYTDYVTAHSKIPVMCPGGRVPIEILNGIEEEMPIVMK